jgi:hypothetical protein
MRRLAPGLLLLLIATAPAGAATSCDATASSALAVCIANAGKALRQCAGRSRAPCTSDAGATGAAERLADKVERRCDADAIAAAGYPAPIDTGVLTARLRRTCLAHAGALVTRAFDTSEEERCAAVLAVTGAKMALAELRASAACLRAGGRCRPDRVRARLTAFAQRAVQKSRRRCGGDAAGIAIVVAARQQTTCALGDALPAATACAPTTAEALVDLWHLAAARRPGVVAGQVSSYDRSGGNLDFGLGPDTAPFLEDLGLPPFTLDHSYLYRDGDRYVVFDEIGPGVVWRIWMTGLDALFANALGGDIAFELDDEPTPRLVLAREALFSGAAAPFLAPLASNDDFSSGGFNSLTPIPFARRLRITTSNAPNWLHVGFTRLPANQPVTSFDPTIDVTAAAARLAQAGAPGTTVTPTTTVETAVAVAPGATQTVGRDDGPGTIVRLELLSPPGADVPLGLRLRGTFDGTTTIDAPLDELFGAALGAGAKSIAFGRDGDRYYCYFPMPYDEHAELELRNDGPDEVTGWTVRVGTVDALPPGPLRHLHATATALSVPADGRDTVLLDVPGSGHVVGVVLTAGCGVEGECQLPTLPGQDGTHLEGDERIHVDQSRWPQIHGTGLEDFFGGGFYFVRGAFNLPTHGNPAQAAATSSRRPGRNLRSAYRVLLGDAIPFSSHIRLAFEHGGENDAPAEVSSVVYWYGTPAASLAESDRLVVGDPASEAAHALTVEGRSDVTLESHFRGDDSDVPVEADGMTATVTRFEVAVDPAAKGVRLRRLTDLGESGQRARVSVDGVFAGIWQTTEVNTVLRWAEVELELPASVTGGKTRLAVEIDSSASPAPWRAFEYTALSHLPQ